VETIGKIEVIIVKNAEFVNLREVFAKFLSVKTTNAQKIPAAGAFP
jgi:hypothetical protein